MFWSLNVSLRVKFIPQHFKSANLILQLSFVGQIQVFLIYGRSFFSIDTVDFRLPHLSTFD